MPVKIAWKIQSGNCRGTSFNSGNSFPSYGYASYQPDRNSRKKDGRVYYQLNQETLREIMKCFEEILLSMQC